MATENRKRKNDPQKSGAPLGNMLGNFVPADAGEARSDAPLGNFEASNKKQGQNEAQ